MTALMIQPQVDPPPFQSSTHIQHSSVETHIHESDMVYTWLHRCYARINIITKFKLSASKTTNIIDKITPLYPVKFSPIKLSAFKLLCFNIINPSTKKRSYLMSSTVIKQMYKIIKYSYRTFVHIIDQ